MTNQPKWREIIAEHIEEDGVFSILHVDAYKTDDENESGENIAELVGVVIDGEPHVYTVFKNPDAQIDDMAVTTIKQATLELEAALRANV